MTLVNGKPANTLALADRGLHYGDGLFETMAVGDGKPELWQRHLGRLQHGCERLGMVMPAAETLWSEACRVCAGTDRAVLKLILTRGNGGRGYQPPVQPYPTRILSLHSWPEYPETWWRGGVQVRVCQHRLSINQALAGLKHLNRLDQVLARCEWRDVTIAEGLMLDPSDQIIEGTMSNLFWGKGGCLFTPDLTHAGVAGVMRGLVIDAAAALGISCTITSLSLVDLVQADEVFLCNSIIGVWPVQRLENTVYTAPGPVTARIGNLISEYRRV